MNYFYFKSIAYAYIYDTHGGLEEGQRSNLSYELSFLDQIKVSWDSKGFEIGTWSEA